MDYFVPVAGSAIPSFAGTTLLLPQPSLASLPQLATDLLVHTLKLQVVGYLGLRDYIPTVGGLDRVQGDPTPGAGAGFCMGVEVYKNDTITLVLPRSPVIKGRKPHHLVALKAFITAGQFKDVLVLASVDAGARGDEGLRSMTPLSHYVPFATPPTALSTSLEQLTPPYASPSSASTTIPLFPQGGLTRGILESFVEDKSTPVVALLIYAAEGDNSQSAYFFADALTEVLGIQVARDGEGAKVWAEPLSWATGLLGAELGRERVGEMYG